MIRLGPGPHAGDGGRLPRRQPLLRAGDAVGLARHLALGAGGQPARRPGRATAWSRRSSWRRPRRTPRPRPSTGRPRRHLHADDRPGDRRAARACRSSRRVFNQIIAVTIVIALVVVALFFALITIERTALYGVLKALGASSGTLFAGVLLQALVVTAIASADRRRRVARARRRDPGGLDPVQRPRPPAAQQRRLPRGGGRHRLRILPAAGAEHRSRLRDRRRAVTPPDRHHRPLGPTEPLMTAIAIDVALRMEGVRKTYPVGDDEVVALDGVDLTVGADEIVALVGPSGSGKTTLCSIAGGLLTPTAGTVVMGGEDISRLHAQAAHPVPPRLGRLRLPDGQPGPVPHGSGEPAGGRRDRPPHGRAGASPRRSAASTSSAWPTVPATCRRSSRAGRSSGWPSAAR